jgi:dihydrodipicolinate synthase/N-acetylneuraminate lyase
VFSRRDFLQATALTLAGRSSAGMRGIFPILDEPGELESLAGARGVVWPREDDAAAVVAAARRRGLAVILCVQGQDIGSTQRYAHRADRLRPDAVMAAPLRELGELARHYRAIAGECTLPLVAHAAGDIPIEFILRMRREIPTLRMVKDEAGHTLSRISEYRRVAPDLAVFIGAGTRLLTDALERGAAGAMPPARKWNRCASS